MKASFDGNAIALILGELDGNTKRLGTAFCFLKAGWFVTAKHVVIDDTTNLVRQNLIISSQAGDKPMKLGFPKVIFAHDYHDIAMIDVGGDYCKRPFFPAHHEFAAKKGFFRIGYNPTQNSMDVERINKFNIETRERKNENETLFTFRDPKAVGGNSGGPLICNGGGVIGLITEASTESKICRATSIDVLLNQLELKTLRIKKDN